MKSPHDAAYPTTREAPSTRAERHVTRTELDLRIGSGSSRCLRSAQVQLDRQSSIPAADIRAAGSEWMMPNP
jgi:hypothetical protein